jgi:hypothetical protein
MRLRLALDWHVLAGLTEYRNLRGPMKPPRKRARMRQAALYDLPAIAVISRWHLSAKATQTRFQ